MFDPVDPKQSFPDLEHGILRYWREEDTFRRSIELRTGREHFSFYDGPPFATGLPHYGHLLTGTIKDVIPRYQTMRGKYVQRRFGWDCHGLPVENLIEQENGLKTKRDIEAMGVDRFNDLCRTSVMRYVKEWRTTVERVGRWVDMDWDYRTMDPDYMESIWWVFKSLFDKNLVYEGHKPMHICPRCVTPLSNFEVTQGYKDVTDITATVSFPLKDEPGVSLLAWTTTPWTLPGNVFVAVHPEIEYMQARREGDDRSYIAARPFFTETTAAPGKEWIMEKTMLGKDLLGKRYEPLFPYFAKEYEKTAFKVVEGSFVTTEDGTGLVHIAPGFGEDDFNVGKREKAKLLQHVTMDGRFIGAVTDFAGQEVKPIDDPSKTDRKVIEWLEAHSRLFTRGNQRHSYPHCWRCDSPLLNYATSSWFVTVERIKEDMLASNAKTEWVPSHIRDGRFGKWLEGARDWAISRNRYWGTPLPIWRSDDAGEPDVIGGRDDLMAHNRIRFTKVTTVRHGEGDHNIGRFYQSEAPGVSLTERGIQQAKEAGQFLSERNVSVIYCSPLQRTQETARHIAEATGATVIVDERLREVGCGKYEGQSIDTSDLSRVKLRRQKKLEANTPESIYHLEGMEGWAEVYARISSFLDEILPRHRSDHIVIVTHADPIMSIRHYFTKEDPFKLSHRPYPAFATPESFFWDHDRNEQMDLHKNFMDSIVWPGSDEKKAIEAVFVRHGETDVNKNRLMQDGAVDAPLNATGREQAAQLAATLKKKKVHFDAIVSSDLIRAKETAAIVAKALGVSSVVHLPVLRERMTGAWSNKPIAEIIEQHPTRPENGSIAFHHETPEGGESLSEFMRRMQDAYEELLRDFGGKRILVVCHSGIVQGMRTIVENLSFTEAAAARPGNCETVDLTLRPFMRRIPEVLDCWFESGAMPYAQQHFPFEPRHTVLMTPAPDLADTGRGAAGESSADAHLPHETTGFPPGFPADFIAEGIDQTRGWFYTLTVLSSALFQKPAFRHCVVNGIVLAEDGRKMSKRLKNYPEPTEVVEEFGADALRFALMSSSAVRGEDLRFSTHIVEETVRNVLLPLWNSYSFFVTYANVAQFEPVAKPKASNHPLDRWIKTEVQDLINRMTHELDSYDLSATCGELHETIDALTNWYIRLSRRRFAGKGMTGDAVPEAEPEQFEGDRFDALNTLYDVLITVSQLLAPFCPFVTEAIYLNLVPEKHGSVHLTDWPEPRELSDEERKLLAKNRLLRQIVSLGLKVRADSTVKLRQPLRRAVVAFPAALLAGNSMEPEDIALLRQELNVKEVVFADDPGSLGEKIVMVDARKVGPRLGARVQDIIRAGKAGEFEVAEDGSILIQDITLGADEATVIYRGKEGQDIAAEHGVVLGLDTSVSEELKTEGLARDLIRVIQRLRKEAGLSVSDRINLSIEGADAILAAHGTFIAQETNAIFGENPGSVQTSDIDGLPLKIRFQKI